MSDDESTSGGSDRSNAWTWFFVLGVLWLVVKIYGGGASSPDSARYRYSLPANPGDRYIAPYYRSDGTRVRGHYRTNADHTRLNNYNGPYGEYYRSLNGK